MMSVFFVMSVIAEMTNFAHGGELARVPSPPAPSCPNLAGSYKFSVKDHNGTLQSGGLTVQQSACESLTFTFPDHLNSNFLGVGARAPAGDISCYAFFASQPELEGVTGGAIMSLMWLGSYPSTPSSYSGLNCGLGVTVKFPMFHEILGRPLDANPFREYAHTLLRVWTSDPNELAFVSYTTSATNHLSVAAYDFLASFVKQSDGSLRTTFRKNNQSQVLVLEPY